MDESGERQWTRRGFIAAGSALAGAVAISGVSNLMKPKSEPVSPETIAKMRERKILNTQIRILNSLREKDFLAVIQSGSVKEREDEFTRLLDDRFNTTITDVSLDIKTETRNRLIEWFHDTPDIQNASTPEEMGKIVKMKWGLLGREFNSPKKGSLNGVTDKLTQ